MQRIEHHDIIVRVLFTIVTCGLYGLYWMAQVTNDVHKLSGKPTCASGGKAAFFSVITCSFYFYYWMYKIGGELVEARRSLGLKLDAESNMTYTIVIIAMTFVVTAVSSLQAIGNLPEDAFDGMSDDAAVLTILLFLLGASIVIFLVQCILSALLLFLVYKRSDPNPRILYVALSILRTNIFTLAFLQASLNDVADALDDNPYGSVE